uniref:ATP-dependent RNA helicase n=1 Tax=Parascaris univalens TaxID=6257 RepID=A0A915B7X4_PARUN
KMENADDRELAALLPPQVLNVFLNDFSFSTFTAVQLFSTFDGIVVFDLPIIHLV